MIEAPFLSIGLALLPVSAFLLALVLLDSFKLVSAGRLSRALAAGAATALVAGQVHRWLLDASVVEVQTLSRYVAPVTEETLKFMAFILVVRRRHVGFLVDAAILGFAVGAGFALVENVEYLSALANRSAWLWAARGFGTAMLHGTTTAIVAIMVKALGDTGAAWRPLVGVPGWAIATLLHAAFNHALVSPVLSATLLMTLVPLAVGVVFERSERATREWFGAGLDRDVELLNVLLSAQFGESRLGRYLHELKSRFPGPVVADMFCWLRLKTELAIRAKGVLMARDAGLEVPPLGLEARFEELRYLERSIGRTGLITLRPLQPVGPSDRWHHTLLRVRRTAFRRRPGSVAGGIRGGRFER